MTTFAGALNQPGTADGDRMSARFREPEGIALDGAGNLYVADTDNHTIRRIVLATGVVTTIAGTVGVFGAVDGVGTAARSIGRRRWRSTAPATCSSSTTTTPRSAGSRSPTAA